MLVSAHEDADSGALSAHSTILAGDQAPNKAGKYQYGWGSLETSTTNAPLDIDGNAHQYVRMKIRRIGPGGYGPDSWLGVCQPTTNPGSATHGGSYWRPTLGLTPTQWNAGTSVSGMPTSPEMSNRSNFYASANTAQPSTLINSTDVLPNSKSPWHILEWDMWTLGQTDPLENGDIYPASGGVTMWKDANPSTGGSPQDPEGTGRRIGAMSFQLCYEPDNTPVGEKFEIAWIQVDDGTGWPRGSYALPGGYANTWVSEADDNDTGTGTGGAPYRIRASESTDFSNQTIGDFSVTVAPAATTPSEISTGAPVLYVHSDKSIINSGMIDQISDANGAIFRVSANTANNLDWIVTEVIDSEKFLRTAPGSPALGDYVGSDLTANGRFSGPVILDTDVHDNLYVGYVYEDHDAGYPGFDATGDSKPLMLFRLTPTAFIDDIDYTGLDAQVCFSNDNESAVYKETIDSTIEVVTIDSSIVPPDSTMGASWRAFNVEDGLTRTFSITAKSTVDSAAGYYVRIYEYYDELPADKYYIADGYQYPINPIGGPNVQGHKSPTFLTPHGGGVQAAGYIDQTVGEFAHVPALTSGAPFEAQALVADTWTTHNFTYTPTKRSTGDRAKWASVVLLNFLGGNGKLHVQPIHMQAGANFSPHNLRASDSPTPGGRSKTYSAEQILWGNTGGTDGIGVMVGGTHLYGLSDNEWAASEIGGGSGAFVDLSTDDLGSLYVVGSGSQNIIKILPAANTSYANGVTRISSDLVGQLPGRLVFEIANTTTLDANNDVLGNWRPTNIISGPKDSLFVACDTGYDPISCCDNTKCCNWNTLYQECLSGICEHAIIYCVASDRLSCSS